MDLPPFWPDPPSAVASLKAPSPLSSAPVSAALVLASFLPSLPVSSTPAGLLPTGLSVFFFFKKGTTVSNVNYYILRNA